MAYFYNVYDFTGAPVMRDMTYEDLLYWAFNNGMAIFCKDENPCGAYMISNPRVGCSIEASQ